MIGQATRASTIASETIGFIGDGRFATALASVLAATDRAAVLFTRDSALRRDINRNHRSGKLPGVSLSKKVAATSNPAELAELCELIIVALPSTRVVDELAEFDGVFGDKHVLAHAVGGLIDGRRGVSSIIQESIGTTRTVALAGPALPRDLSARRSCAMVAASASEEVLEFTKSKLHCPPVLRIYKNHDVGGVELSAAIANALTVMLGIADGLRIGDGPRTVALTRGVAEGAKLVAASGGNRQTFYGMSGLGNLLVRTSASSRAHSIDYEIGLALGNDRKPPCASSEGTRALAAIVLLGAQLGLDIPLCRMVNEVVCGNMSVDSAADALSMLDTEHE